MRMLLPLIKQLTTGGPQRAPAVVWPKLTAASEKADVELCVATDQSRPTIAGYVALSNRQVSNRNGHSPAGQLRCQDG